MAKKKFDYYDAFQKQGAYLAEAVAGLEGVLNDYGQPALKEALAAMRITETEADGVNFKIRKRLHDDLLTPVDRTDILYLALALDDAVDDVEAVMRCFYMYGVVQVDEEMRVMLSCLKEATEALNDALELLPKYRKKADKIFKRLERVRHAEDEVDALHVEAVHNLYNVQLGCIPATQQGKVAVCVAFRQVLTSVELSASRIEELIMSNS